MFEGCIVRFPVQVLRLNNNTYSDAARTEWGSVYIEQWPGRNMPHTVTIENYRLQSCPADA